MAVFHRYLILFSAFLGFAAALSGQEASPPAVDLHFSVFSESVLTDLTYQPAEDEAREVLQFYSTQRSPEYAYRGPRQLQFFKGADTTQPAAVYVADPQLEKVLLLFSPTPADAPAGSLPLQVIGVDDSSAHIPPGHFVILNLTGREYEAHYGKARIAVPVGLSEATPASSQKYLRLVADINGVSTAVGGVPFGLLSGQRAVIVLYPPMRKTALQPQIRTLYEESSAIPRSKRSKK